MTVVGEVQAGQFTTHVLAAACSARKSEPAAVSAFSEIEDAVAQLSKITGMRPVKKVPYDTITRPQFKSEIKSDKKHG